MLNLNMGETGKDLSVARKYGRELTAEEAATNARAREMVAKLREGEDVESESGIRKSDIADYLELRANQVEAEASFEGVSDVLAGEILLGSRDIDEEREFPTNEGGRRALVDFAKSHGMNDPVAAAAQLVVDSGKAIIKTSIARGVNFEGMLSEIRSAQTEPVSKE